MSGWLPSRDFGVTVVDYGGGSFGLRLNGCGHRLAERPLVPDAWWIRSTWIELCAHAWQVQREIAEIHRINVEKARLQAQLDAAVAREGR
jgi:hypothetical protein